MDQIQISCQSRRHAAVFFCSIVLSCISVLVSYDALASGDGKWSSTLDLSLASPGIGVSVFNSSAFNLGGSYFRNHTRTNPSESFELDQYLSGDTRYFFLDSLNVGGSVFLRHKNLNFSNASGSRQETGVKSNTLGMGAGFSLGNLWQWGSFLVGGDWIDIRWPLYQLSTSTSGRSSLEEERINEIKTDTRDASSRVQLTLLKLKIGFAF